MERKKKILAAALAALVLAGGGAWLLLAKKYGGLGGAVAAALAETASRKAGRELRIKSVSFSPLGGLTLRGVSVSEKPSFIKGVFFSAEKARLAVALMPLLRGSVVFSAAEFDGVFFKVREKDGEWNFRDLLALLPDTVKGLHLTWNARRLVFRGARVQADLTTAGLSLDMTETDAVVKHYSSFGGNFNIEASGRAGTAWGGRLFTGAYEAKIDLNFTTLGLASSSGRLAMTDLELGDMRLARLGGRWDFFRIGRGAARNYSLEAEASDFFAPGYRSPFRDAVDKGLKSIFSAMGAAPPKTEDIKADSLSARASLKGGRLRVEELRLEADFARLRAAFAAGAGPETELEIEAEAAGKKFRARASGTDARPRVEPELSESLREALLASRRGLKEFFTAKLKI
ncbi:MAG: hypothetical protein FD189_683 [Elusimicrobia bacterium]|nr:MAG: hypothetical protein FD154_1306 [Elusimicrobiota bacterium]KAF0157114.1 MAG: hypothetical protein FD189_683 [Elusimicrobiota bacterium]